jgi:hypothetical protein
MTQVRDEVRHDVPDDLNPGIRKTVEWLRSHGFNPVDSGDGVTHECDRDEAYCVMSVDSDKLVAEAARLCLLLESNGIMVSPQGPDALVSIQATYDPADGSSVIDLAGMDDGLLPPTIHLTQQGTMAFIAALENPPKPNEVMTEAARRYRVMVG